MLQNKETLSWEAIVVSIQRKANGVLSLASPDLIEVSK